MDSLTHILLGGCIGYAIAGKRLGPLAFFVPAIAATLPDMDVFIHTGDPVQDHLVHRTFLHSFLLVPLLAALASFPFALSPRVNAHWKILYALAFLACMSHPLLDACTSYGTMFLWPFSPTRFAWDLIAVVDLFFTLPLLVALIWSMRARSATPARVALAWCALYLVIAVWQHQRALWAQLTLIASRHQDAQNPRVLPQIGAVLNYRSIYIADNRIVADAIRVPPFGAASYRPGSSLPLVDVTDLQPFPAPPAIAADFDGFTAFADGFVARMPDHPDSLGDMRYPLTPESFNALWGIQLENTPTPAWQTFPRLSFISKLWRDLINPRDFQPLP